jgi:hypothetical protein
MVKSARTFLLFELNALLDTGKYNSIDIESVKEAISNRSVPSYLKRISGGELDVSLLQTDDWNALHSEWDDMSNAIDAERKMGVRRNGICLLIAYLTESLQRTIREMPAPKAEAGGGRNERCPGVTTGDDRMIR